MTHLENGDIDLVEQDFDFFLRSQNKALSMTFSTRIPIIVLTFNCARRLFSMHQKISVLRSKTWLTEERAFLLIPRQRYCLVAKRKGVSSEDDDDGTTMVGSAKTSEWDCKIAKTRCRESNLDRIS